jgi:hypothetical protein
MTTRIGPDLMEIPDEQYGPPCLICGCEMERERCDQCGGEGLFGHDCGEDVCCCLEPEENEVCEQCGGDGGWWYCPNASHHPEVPV